MHVLVSGMSGFVGSALEQDLRARNHTVQRADRDGLSGTADGLVHLANIAHTRVSDAELQRVNVEGTRRMGLEAVKRGIRRFVYLSSIKAEYPDDEYGRSKLAAESAIKEVAAQTDLEVVVLRPPLVYGAGVKANFLALMHAIDRGLPLPLASIANRRSLIYVGNLTDAIICCLRVKAATGRSYAVSDGATVSTPELCRSMGAALGRPARLFPFPIAALELLPAMKKLTGSVVVNNAAIRAELGWQPPYSFEQGLRLTAQWYRGR